MIWIWPENSVRDGIKRNKDLKTAYTEFWKIAIINGWDTGAVSRLSLFTTITLH